MSKKKIRYTEYTLSTLPSNAMGWLKLVLMYIVVSPLRLVTEISQKCLYLDELTLRKVTLYGLYINIGFVVWSLLWDIVAGKTPFIPYTVMLISMGIVAFTYIRVQELKGPGYKILENVEETEEDDLKESIQEETIAFGKVAASDVGFEDSINLFIKDPEELESLGLDPAVYDTSEDERLLNAIETRADMFSYEKIGIPDVFAEPPLGSQLESNFKSLIEDLDLQVMVG